MSTHNLEHMLRDIIEREFSPLRLEILDDSHKHKGHAGNPEGVTGTHWTITVVSAIFIGKRLLERHKLVYAKLEHLIPPIHALSLKLQTPEDAKEQR